MIPSITALFPNIHLRGSRPCMLLACAILTACGDGADADAGGGTTGGGMVKAEVTAEKVQGLFFMTRYTSFGGLEKAVWYFSPDGMAYENPAGSFTKADLAAHPGRMGKVRIEADKMTITWTGGSQTGKEQSGSFEPTPDENAFFWDLGNFVPVRGFEADHDLTGKWQGGISVGSAGNGASVARTLELRADGTFSMSGASSVRATSDESTARAGAAGDIAGGQWKRGSHALTLGERTAVAFPWDDEDTPVNPDQFYFDGIMWSRLAE